MSFISFSLDLWSLARQELLISTMQAELSKGSAFLFHNMKKIYLLFTFMTFVIISVCAKEFDPLTTPLTVEAIENGTTITFSNPLKLNIYYSTDDGETWQSDNKTTITIGEIGAGNKVCFVGDNPAYGKYVNFQGVLKENCSNINFNKNCFVYGNIMSLISSRNYATETELTSDYVFSFLFSNNSHLLAHSTKALALPATKLSKGCYFAMFSGCVNLVSAPVLPATTMADGCYMRMFEDCSGLISAPELPATTLDFSCYDWMFIRCSSMTTAPSVLPATILVNGCYGAMFAYCTSLTEAPQLSATTMDVSSCNSMFTGCSSLIVAPELPATTLADECYAWMFSDCSSLTTPPDLPAITLADGCYCGMFEGCSNLVTAPDLPATILEAKCYRRMFMGCTNLKVAPDLPAATLADYSYFNMFTDCINLNYVKCLAKDISAVECTKNWLSNVAATGTFVKAEDMQFWTMGANGIPEGWTTENVTGITGIRPTDTFAPTFYDMNGRRIDSPMRKGIFIVDGQKSMIKVGSSGYNINKW